MKNALITGVTGQDGSYLAELLLEKGYNVYGMVRRSSTNNFWRIEKALEHDNFKIVNGDMTDSLSVVKLISQIEPDEIYNLAAQSFVGVSFDVPEYTANTDALGTLRVLDAVKMLGSHARIYQASTSELYGKVAEVPQSETTPFYPRSPYGVAKQYGYWITKNYKEAYDIFASNGILFNHESERRGEEFVTRKITLAAARIKAGLQKTLYLGNVNSKRDWGYAPDYVQCMWKILQVDHPDDFVIATGEAHTIKEFCNEAFNVAGIELNWEGEGINEFAYDRKSKEKIIIIDPKFFRPTEVDLLLGNPAKAQKLLGFDPKKTPFKKLVEIMTLGDIKKIREEEM